MSAAAKVARYKARLRAAGLCVRCRRPNDRPRHRCLDCTRAHARRHDGERRWACGCCGEPGHNARTCPDPRAREVVA